MENNSKPQSEPTEKASSAKSTSGKTKFNLVAFRRIFLIVLLLVLVAIPGFVALWFIYHQQDELEVLQQNVSPIATLAAKTENLSTEFGSVQRSLSQVSENQQQIQQLQQQIQALQQQSPLTSDEIELQWALQEIEYLLNLANQRATLANDASGAKKALSLADEIIRKLADYRLQALRQQIADDMLALEAVAKTDVAGMAADLQSGIESIDSLRVVKGPRQTRNDPMADAAADFTTNDWKQAASEVWQQIRSLVVIRQQEDAPQAVLMPEQRYFLYQNLRLKLETTRFALLSGNQSVYQSSLQAASEWLERYFTGDERDALLQTLAELQAQQIEIDMPDISASLRELQRFEP